MGVVENMKDFADLIKKVGDIELYRKILGLETEVLDLSRDKRRADEKIEELERTLKFKNELKFEDPYYWLEGDPAPYCPACWDSKRIAAHIVSVREIGHYDQHQCPSCKHVFDNGARTSPTRGLTSRS